MLDPGVGLGSDVHPLVLSEDRWAGRLSSSDFPSPVTPLGRLKVPRGFNHRSPQDRRDLASSLRALRLSADRPRRARSSAADDEVLAGLRAALRRHPVHGCDDREAHLRWAERWARLRGETDTLERKVEGKTHSIARTFDRVCALLEQQGYLAGDTVTDTGRQLARVYSETDLLVVECLRSGLWDDLTPAELAAVVSALVHETRRPDDVGPPVPTGPVQAALREMARVWERLSRAESEQGLSFLREPDPGFAWAAWRWASGAALDQVLVDDQEMTAGDFVRSCKQLVDLLGQVADVAALGGSPLRRTARQAVEAVRRGVVAYS